MSVLFSCCTHLNILSIREAQAVGIWAYDCFTKELVLLIIWVLALLGDNLMQSEFACHAGLRARFFCHMCWVKGYDAEDADDAMGERSTKAEPLKVMIERIKRFMKVDHIYLVFTQH